MTQDKKVYLFGTCLIDTFYPKAGLDAAALLELCDWQIEFPPNQGCCGQPPFNSGFTADAIDAAKQTIQTFSHQNYPFIVPSASCAGMIRQHYPRLFEDQPEWQKAANLLAERTYELIEFIIDKLPYDHLENGDLPAQPSLRIALHESCAAQRETNVATHWRKAIESIPHTELLIPDYHEECCGFGGTFAVKAANISATMAADKINQLKQLQPDLVVSGDCGCLMNLQGYADHQRIKLNFAHLTRFLATQFGVSHDV